MPNARIPDPNFPDRPTHEDFAILAETAQAHDAMAEQLNMHVFKDVVQVDEASFVYFAQNRMGIWSQLTHRDLPGSASGRAAMLALYTDAFALGQAFAERRREEEST